MKLKKIWIVLSLLLLVLTGCGTQQEEEKTDGYKVYYVNWEEAKIVSESVEIEENLIADLIKQLTVQLFETSHGEKDMYLFPEEVSLLDYQLKENVLELNYNKAYQQMERMKEVLVRASIVRTYVQISGVDYVKILIEGTPFLDSYGKEVGILNEESFLESSGNEINAYQLAHMTLYFSNDTGDGLVKENRSVYYSTSMPLERAIVEELLKGPKVTGNYPTLSSETKVLGVTVADGICYVNLNQSFSNQALNQQEEIPIYSITNSLVESGSVSQVQISINGDTKLMYRDNVSLDQFFRKNTEIIVEESDE